jgi:spermidine synthase
MESEFLEAGLGLGFSAMHIASQPTTRRHTVIELHQQVIDYFLARNPTPPAALEIIKGDFFAMLPTLPPASVDGIFFDPYLPVKTRNDPAFWNIVVPPMIALLRPGGVFVPCFTTQPYFLFLNYFDHAIIERRHYTAYPQTSYTVATSGRRLHSMLFGKRLAMNFVCVRSSPDKPLKSVKSAKSAVSIPEFRLKRRRRARIEAALCLRAGAHSRGAGVRPVALMFAVFRDGAKRNSQFASNFSNGLSFRKLAGTLTIFRICRDNEPTPW